MKILNSKLVGIKRIIFSLLLAGFLFNGCNRTTIVNENQSSIAPFVWQAANVYFLLTDRFNNGDPSNDLNFDRNKPPALLRGFMGGDIRGITQKITEGYFDDLGINVIWFTPVFEQIHGMVNEGTGGTYGFHGYWTKDWTALDPNFGTAQDLKNLVETAHKHGIRILIDAIINHTGPVTDLDPVWPSDWVRTGPICTYQGYESTIKCTLVKNLPDIKTESDKDVALPEQLTEKWTREGRREKELQELDVFFERTGYPRAPRFYIMKWLTDLIREYGVDGFRIDTAKHTEETVWSELWEEAVIAFREWKMRNPEKVLDNNEFFMLGEVYNYMISSGKGFNFGDTIVNFFDHGLQSLINFEFKSDANASYEKIFTKYSAILNGELKGNSVLNYISSHDDPAPYDKLRVKPFEAGTKLLLSPGAAQIYYGDETSRSLDIPGTKGDATLRSFMNWEELEQNTVRNGFPVKEVLEHWQKLGQFRRAHPAVGAGVHQMISKEPYYFKRTYQSNNFSDVVVVGLNLNKETKEVDVGSLFGNRSIVKDYYSDQQLRIKNGKIKFNSDFDIVLIGF